MSELIELVDIGANLTHDSFDRDRAEVIARAADAGVTRLIVTGASMEGSTQAAALACEYPEQLFATAGVHPHHASEFDADVDAGIRGLAEEAVAVGECGLDFFRDFSPRDAQLTAFEAQLHMAAETDKPVFLHQRDAHDPFVALLRQYLPKIPGGVAHCFTGNRTELGEYLDMGLYIGITGWICDERRAADLREAVKFLPLDRVLLETDAPYLLPRDLDDPPPARRNEPSLLPHVLETTARYMSQPATAVATAATRNTAQLFRLSDDGPSSRQKNSRA
jgi:TatD DNase family protein